jgi:hypothetical protein
LTESITGPIFEIREGIVASVTTSRALRGPTALLPPNLSPTGFGADGSLLIHSAISSVESLEDERRQRIEQRSHQSALASMAEERSLSLALPSPSKFCSRFLRKEKCGISARVNFIELVCIYGIPVKEFGIQRSVPLTAAPIVFPQFELATTKFLNGVPAVAQLFCLNDEKAYAVFFDFGTTGNAVKRILIHINSGQPLQFPIKPIEGISVIESLPEAINQGIYAFATTAIRSYFTEIIGQPVVQIVKIHRNIPAYRVAYHCDYF